MSAGRGSCVPEPKHPASKSTHVLTCTPSDSPSCLTPTQSRESGNLHLDIYALLFQDRSLTFVSTDPATQVAVRWTHAVRGNGSHALKPAASKQEKKTEMERVRHR